MSPRSLELTVATDRASISVAAQIRYRRGAHWVSLFTVATIALVRAHRHISNRLSVPVHAIAIPKRTTGELTHAPNGSTAVALPASA